MVSFIHIADKNSEQAILRAGIRAFKRRSGLRGVYAMPVVPNFSTTHQWARDLKRRGNRTQICVQFRIADKEPVMVDKYNGEKIEMTAAEASGTALTHTDPMGLEVIISRKSPQTRSREFMLRLGSRVGAIISALKGNRPSATADGAIVEKYVPAGSSGMTTDR